MRPHRPQLRNQARTLFAVDRIESHVAVLIDEGGIAHDVSVTEFPTSPAEGICYRVPISSDGTPVWADAERDLAEEQRRRDAVAEQLARLSTRDPGGDLDL